MEKYIKKLKDELFYKTKQCAQINIDDEKKEFEEIISGYKYFLNNSKIEREGVAEIKKKAEQKGFIEYKRGMELKAGDKIYTTNRKKNIILAIIGKEELNKGIKMVAAHLDSPRLDLKPNPLYESNGLAYFKTHYYGGIKKYQWASIPLSLHGIIIKKDGEIINVNIGDDENDPILCVNDLLVHLSNEQMKRTPKELIKGEELNALIGSNSIVTELNSQETQTELVKLNILSILKEKYGINERDFISSELSLTPAVKARDVGFDKSLIGAYGHDDKVCAYTAYKSLLDLDFSKQKKTVMAVLIDKEETGSDGNTGIKSNFLNYFIEDLAYSTKQNARDILTNSTCLSADVSAGYDPNFPDVLEKRNGAFVGRGITINKYTGSGGKYSTSDASAEFLNEITRLYDDNNIFWQMSELGKVDAGGGGTIAKILANLNMEVLDVGIAVLGMHSPFELVNKLDVYQAYKGYKIFYIS